MGDLSKEPSMEEILSSIKRIIAEDVDSATGGKDDAERRSIHRKAVVASMADSEDRPSYVDEVLELTSEVPRDTAKEDDRSEDRPEKGMAQPKKSTASATQDKTEQQAGAATQAPKADDSMIVSMESELAARSSLAALSSMMVKPADGSENTLEGLVREMLRPMLKEWLDAKLPTLVEGMVAKEIARITGRSL